MKYLALPFIILAPFSIYTMANSETADMKTLPFAASISLPDTNGITADNFGYSYIAPENWTWENGNGYNMYTQRLADGSPGCRLIIVASAVSTGKLEDDVKNLFSQMYPGWRFYYSDARRDNVIKGTTKQGAPYYMMEADMVKDRPAGGWDYETGAAVVIGNGKQTAIIALRHEITGLNCLCKKRYDTWQRFFNSFTIKNLNPIKENNTNPFRLIGSWMVSGGRSIGEYIFAANGRFQYLGSFGNYTKISNEWIELKTSTWQGDGSYSIQGDRLILKRNGDKKGDEYRFRFESVNQGSTGWKDRLCLLNEHPLDNLPPYETCYEKREKQ